MKRSDFFWLVGLLEGEGSFFVKRVTVVKRKPAIVLTVSMTDQDVMRRAAKLLETSLMGPYARQRDYYKPLYMAELRNAAAVAWMLKLRPFMGKRRQQQIDLALEEIPNTADAMPQRRNKRAA